MHPLGGQDPVAPLAYSSCITSTKVAPQDSQICGGNFPKHSKSVAELCQILRMVTTSTVINSAHGGVTLCPALFPVAGRCWIF